MSKELNNFTHCSKLDLIKMYKKSRRDMRRLSRQKVALEQENAELKAQIEEKKSIGRTLYIKGIRTMANALKDYDRTDGAWTDYFEHTVDEVLKELLGEI